MIINISADSFNFHLEVVPAWDVLQLYGMVATACKSGHLDRVRLLFNTRLLRPGRSIGYSCIKDGAVIQLVPTLSAKRRLRAQRVAVNRHTDRVLSVLSNTSVMRPDATEFRPGDEPFSRILLNGPDASTDRHAVASSADDSTEPTPAGSNAMAAQISSDSPEGRPIPKNISIFRNETSAASSPRPSPPACLTNNSDEPTVEQSCVVPGSRAQMQATITDFWNMAQGAKSRVPFIPSECCVAGGAAPRALDDVPVPRLMLTSLAWSALTRSEADISPAVTVRNATITEFWIMAQEVKRRVPCLCDTYSFAVKTAADPPGLCCMIANYAWNTWRPGTMKIMDFYDLAQKVKQERPPIRDLYRHSSRLAAGTSQAMLADLAWIPRSSMQALDIFVGTWGSAVHPDWLIGITRSPWSVCRQQDQLQVRRISAMDSSKAKNNAIIQTQNRRVTLTGTDGQRALLVRQDLALVTWLFPAGHEITWNKI
eukprot:TRINITY_DN51933_c0_g1_i1.p1 TRINITY_DN51933_c0_g1~~TRINITY_DN51933_c0_g1_i1.p1  ORF type:complete len:483 (+),score=38.66 TRINITY_DN51933_c0_g1_i1:191-1639(+)